MDGTVDRYERAGDTEEVDALPVLAGDDASVQPARRDGGVAKGSSLGRQVAGLRSVGAVQVAAVAAGGFVAGATAAGLVRRRRRPTRTLGSRGRGGIRRRSGKRSEIVEIVASRSLLVDLHLLGPAGRGR